jgi:hypothetical protein
VIEEDRDSFPAQKRRRTDAGAQPQHDPNAAAIADSAAVASATTDATLPPGVHNDGITDGTDSNVLSSGTPNGKMVIINMLERLAAGIERAFTYALHSPNVTTNDQFTFSNSHSHRLQKRAGYVVRIPEECAWQQRRGEGTNVT